MIADKGLAKVQKIFKSKNNFVKNPKRVSISPKEAKELLKMNTKNRNVKDRHVAWLSAQMQQELWVYTGQRIPVSITGILLDAQHTLLAIIDSGTTQDFIVVCGLLEKSITVIDTGAARTAGDVLEMNGIEHATAQASIAKKVLLYNSGLGTSVAKGCSKRSKKVLITNAMILEAVMNDKRYLEAAKEAALCYRNFNLLRPSIFGFCFYVFTGVDRFKALQFFKDLSTGEGIQSGTPAFTLRNKLIKTANQALQPTREAKLFWLFSAWRKYLDGDSMKNMPVWKKGIAFPKIGK